MDSSHWRNLNRNIKFEQTKKQYFNRYLWRLVYDIKKVNMASDKYITDIVGHVLHGREMERMRKNRPNQGSYYGYYRHDYGSWEDVDEHLVDRIRTVMDTYKDIAKFRTEYNTMQIYTETEEDLKRIAEAVSGDDHLAIINSPNPGTEDSLRNGHVFMPKTEYKFKVVMRDGNYDVQTKQNILNQLSQRKDVKIPPQLKRELGKKYPALWGAYFYTNDDSIVTILSLIHPGCIGKIHPINQSL